MSLSVGLCTFNKEAYFARTAERITALVANEPAVTQVFVVNQGGSFESPRLHDLMAGPKITTIEQRNLGGAGGFSRTLYEAQAAKPPATHHLMMDDDIVLDERLIIRTLQFLRYATSEIAVGGGMLETLRPTFMHEAGAFIGQNITVESYCCDVDLADPGQMYHFNSPVETDFNAWWFCVLPMKPSLRAGLPLPIFIHGDDFEYGQRLAALGVPTVTLPGVAVWHEPFHAKPASWQHYYDLRNQLIFGATYGDKYGQVSVMRVLGLLSIAALTHQYQRAEGHLLAVVDFLDGPAAVFGEDAEKKHKRIMAMSKANASERLNDEVWKPKPTSPWKPFPEGMRNLAISFVKSALVTILLPHRRGEPPIFLDFQNNPRNAEGRAYVLTNGMRTYHLLNRPQRWRTLGLLWRSTMVGLRYRRERDAIAKVWLNEIGRYQSTAYWGDVFRADDSGHEGDVSATPPPSIEPITSATQ